MYKIFPMLYLLVLLKHKLCFKYFVLLLAVFLCSNSVAQKSLTFNSYNSLGIVAGKQPAAFTAQTANGVSVNSWFLGLGLGLDCDYKRTMPLFAVIKKQLLSGKNIPFLYVNAGSNIILNDRVKKDVLSTITTKGGAYADMGLGYKRSVGSRNSIFFTLGYSVKRMHEYGTIPDEYGMAGAYDKQISMNRVAVRAGFQF